MDRVRRASALIERQQPDLQCYSSCMAVEWLPPGLTACAGEILTFKLINRTEGLISFGNEYWVERHDRGTWVRVNEDEAFAAVQHTACDPVASAR